MKWTTSWRRQSEEGRGRQHGRVKDGRGKRHRSGRHRGGRRCGGKHRDGAHTGHSRARKDCRGEGVACSMLGGRVGAAGARRRVLKLKDRTKVATRIAAKFSQPIFCPPLLLTASGLILSRCQPWRRQCRRLSSISAGIIVRLNPTAPLRAAWPPSWDAGAPPQEPRPSTARETPPLPHPARPVCVIRRACPRGIHQCPCHILADNATRLHLTGLRTTAGNDRRRATPKELCFVQCYCLFGVN